MKKTIYIAGKVTGTEITECRAKFGTAQINLQNRGFIVVNPLLVVGDWSTPWDVAMEMCLAALSNCNCIYMLPCSIDSKGAQIELQKAIEMGIDIYYELENVENEPTHNLHG